MKIKLFFLAGFLSLWGHTSFGASTAEDSLQIEKSDNPLSTRGFSPTLNFLQDYSKFWREIGGPSNMWTQNSSNTLSESFLRGGFHYRDNYFSPDYLKKITPNCIADRKVWTEQMIHREKNTPLGFHTLYHGVGQMRLYYDIFSLLKGKEFRDIVFRDTSSIFLGKECNDVNDFLRIISTTDEGTKRPFNFPCELFNPVYKPLKDSQSWHDHTHEVSESLVACNFTLFNGMCSEGECSLYFFLLGNNIGVDDKYNEILKNLGLSDTKIEKLDSLATKYPLIANHGIFEINIDTSILDSIAYLSIPGGRPVCQNENVPAYGTDLTDPQDWSSRVSLREFLASYEKFPKDSIFNTWGENKTIQYYSAFSSSLYPGQIQVRVFPASPLIRYGDNVRVTVVDPPAATKQQAEEYYKELSEILLSNF